MPDKGGAVVAGDDLGLVVQLVLADQVDLVAGTLGPTEEVVVVTRQGPEEAYFFEWPVA